MCPETFTLRHIGSLKCLAQNTLVVTDFKLSPASKASIYGALVLCARLSAIPSKTDSAALHK